MEMAGVVTDSGNSSVLLESLELSLSGRHNRASGPHLSEDICETHSKLRTPGPEIVTKLKAEWECNIRSGTVLAFPAAQAAHT